MNSIPIRKSHQPIAKPRKAVAAEGTGEQGFFSPHSWWPLFLGLSAATAFLGFAIGWWLFLIGMLFTVFAAIGFVFEYYRGNFSH